jgi:hypothetical protein
VELFSSIWVQAETHTLRQEVPPATTDTPDDLQETPDDPQEAPNDLQEVPNDLQESHVMTFSWRDIQFDAEADTQVENHFCGKSDKDPSKTSRAVLFQLLLKEKVASGRLVIDGIVDGVPVIVRGQSWNVDPGAADGGRPSAFPPPNNNGNPRAGKPLSRARGRSSPGSSRGTSLIGGLW